MSNLITPTLPPFTGSILFVLHTSKKAGLKRYAFELIILASPPPPYLNAHQALRARVFTCCLVPGHAQYSVRVHAATDHHGTTLTLKVGNQVTGLQFTIKESINQSINRVFNHSIPQLINQSINRSIIKNEQPINT